MFKNFLEDLISNKDSVIADFIKYYNKYKLDFLKEVYTFFGFMSNEQDNMDIIITIVTYINTFSHFIKEEDLPLTYIYFASGYAKKERKEK